MFFNDLAPEGIHHYFCNILLTTQVSSIHDQSKLHKGIDTNQELRFFGCHLGVWLPHPLTWTLDWDNLCDLELSAPPSGFLCIFQQSPSSKMDILSPSLGDSGTVGFNQQA